MCKQYTIFKLFTSSFCFVLFCFVSLLRTKLVPLRHMGLTTLSSTFCKVKTAQEIWNNLPLFVVTFPWEFQISWFFPAVKRQLFHFFLHYCPNSQQDPRRMYLSSPETNLLRVVTPVSMIKISQSHYLLSTGNPRERKV